jgi:alginate O-acetyltransferase complex protein AlgI
MGYAIGHAKPRQSAFAVLVFALAVDLSLLGYFKYANFFIGATNDLAGTSFAPEAIVLPLGISFFTFTQITFLVDVYRGIAREYNFIHYLLFVTYFPHLIAGPVLHHKQMMPQFADPKTYRWSTDGIANGLTVFAIGLAKKVVLADSLATFARPVFDAVEKGVSVSFFEAWGGALAYTFQLYFDFSGYSDMAIGLSLLFGVTLPVNFCSPYKAHSIAEFWRRWHMTLSQFLREYLYIPLGGNRYGVLRRNLNLMITMLLGGLWHGAAWTFVVWGGLHGAFLVVNHGWSGLVERLNLPFRGESGVARFFAICLTFFCVVAAWVVFRAQSLHGAAAIFAGMAGLNGYVLPEQVAAMLPGATNLVSTVGKMELLGNGSVMGVLEQTSLLALSACICFLCPPTQAMSQRLKMIAVLLSFGFVVQALFFGREPSEFLYFQF